MSRNWSWSWTCAGALSAPALLVMSAACVGSACSSATSDEPDADGSDAEAKVHDGRAPNEAGTREDGGAPRPGDGSAGDAAPDAAPAGALFAFVGSADGKIRTFEVDALGGAWTLKRTSEAGNNPSFLAFDPGRRRVVAVDEVAGGLVRSFSFDPGTGALVEVDSKPAGGAGSTHVSLDPTGTWAMVANYTGGTMSILPLAPGGMLGSAADTRASGAKSHWAGTNPSGGHVFVVALGANAIAQYTLNTTTGKLTDNGSAAPPANAGPRHLTFHPSEKWAYVINELAVTVTTFDFDAKTGKLTAKQTLSALPPGQSSAGVSGAEIALHPTGKHVFVSTRTYNSIAQFAVNDANGTLTRIANVPTGGNRPRSFAISPEGTLLYAANQDRNEVVGFKVDVLTGALTSLGKSVDVASPAFVGLARMP